MVALRVVLTEVVGAWDIYNRFLHKYRKYITVLGGGPICFANQESRDATRAIILPLWVESQSRPVRVRLIGADAELLLGMWIIENCALRADFRNRNLHFAQGA